MKKTAKGLLRNIFVIFTVMAVSVSGLWNTEVFAQQNEDKMTDAGKVSVIFTHDMHSHMGADKVEKDGKVTEVGGFARLKTAIDEIKSEYPESFVLDAGDFAMGTPYQTIFASEASEMKMMKYIGIEATTFGNHEFDYRAEGLTSMLNEADGQGIPLVAANIDWEATLADKTLQEDAKELKAACDAYGVQDYMIIEHEGVKAAVFGIMGESAVDYAPESGLLFKDAGETAAAVVEKIKADGQADIIICLSHCGTVENEEDVMEETEDYLIAQAVPDIDLIISGHTHTVLDEAVQVGDTYIVSSGSYNVNAGHVVLEKNSEDRYELASYELVPLDENVEPDAETAAELDKYSALLDENYFSQYGFSANQVIANNSIDFSDTEEFGIEQGEETLGNLISDSYIHALDQIGESADIAIVPHGVVRGSFVKGEVTVTDAFNVSSLGYGKDGASGYPLVKAYLTGRELKAIAEVDASVSNFMGVARLYCSGLEYSWNLKRLILNRAVDVRFNDGESVVPIEDDRMYSVVADLYSCQMLGMVKAMSYGLLKIEPKDEEGNLIKDFEDHIVYDGEKELKAWYALASYIDSFEGDEIPQYYAQTHERKTEIDSLNPVELFKQPNNIFGIAAGAAVVLILLIAGIVVLVKKRKTKKK